MKSYKELADNKEATIVYPHVKAMLFGVSVVAQDNTGNITAQSSAGNIYNLGVVDDNGPLDILKEYDDENDNYIVSIIAPLMK